MGKTSRMIYIGLLVAQALVLYMFESMIPAPFITTGAKLGLANLLTVIPLFTLGSNKDTFLVVFLRLLDEIEKMASTVILTSLLISNIFYI